MTRDDFMRRALRATVVFNIGGALLFAFPDSLGRVAGLPGPVPHLHGWFIAFMVLLLAATYAWLSAQPRIDRPLVVFAALGKSGFFALVLLCWVLGEVPILGVVAASGDLIFAAIFVWWLIGANGRDDAWVGRAGSH